MPPFSFVHAADIHLDSPFVGIGRLPDEHSHVAETLRDATFGAFEAVIQICIDRQVDFLLIAGDVYDGADRSLRAQLRFRDGLWRLTNQGVRIYVVHGNHDPLDGWSHAVQMPDLVHVFPDRLESVVFEKTGVPVARIHGISYPRNRINADFGKGMAREGVEPFQIGLFHCNAGGDLRYDPYAPRSVAELIETGLDYLALGHIHERVTLHASQPFIGYPGNTQGRHINEAGPRGCLLVNVTAEGQLAAEPEFVATNRVRWEACDIDIAGMETIDDLLSSLDDRMETLAELEHECAIVTRITIKGRGTLHRSLTKPEAMASLQNEARSRGIERSPFIYIEQLLRKTQPAINLNSRRAGQDFLGELLRLIEEMRRSPEQLDEVSDVLNELYQHARAKRLLDAVDERAMRELLDEAELRCADLMADEED